MPSPNEIIALRELKAPTTPIFPAIRVEVPDILVFGNAARFDPAFASHLAQDIYAARTVCCDAVDLVELPPGTIVDGRSFLTLADHRWVRDQCHPELLSRSSGVEALHSGAIAGFWAGIPVREVSTPCLLVARYGETTWGHWLGELLPRALAAELSAPGHFTFAIPELAGASPYAATMRRNVHSSLAAYGIGSNRLLLLSPSLLYRFASLSAVTSVWTRPRMMHPGMMDLMRGLLDQVDGSHHPERVFIQRAPSMGRTVVNEASILAAAGRRGYVPVSLPDLPFVDQIRCFSRASRIVSVLGSDLSGLIYSPDGNRVLSLAPSTWGDNFFSTLIQMRRGRYADLRGTPVGEGSLHRRPFSVDLDEFESALNAIG